MGSNREKSNYPIALSNGTTAIKLVGILIWKSNNFIGINREKSNIVIAILSTILFLVILNWKNK